MPGFSKLSNALRSCRPQCIRKPRYFLGGLASSNDVKLLKGELVAAILQCRADRNLLELVDVLVILGAVTIDSHCVILSWCNGLADAQKPPHNDVRWRSIFLWQESPPMLLAGKNRMSCRSIEHRFYALLESAACGVFHGTPTAPPPVWGQGHTVVCLTRS